MGTGTWPQRARTSSPPRRTQGRKPGATTTPREGTPPGTDVRAEDGSFSRSLLSGWLAGHSSRSQPFQELSFQTMVEAKRPAHVATGAALDAVVRFDVDGLGLDDDSSGRADGLAEGDTATLSANHLQHLGHSSTVVRQVAEPRPCLSQDPLRFLSVSVHDVGYARDFGRLAGKRHQVVSIHVAEGELPCPSHQLL